MLSAIQISKKFKDRIILNETSCEFEKEKSYAIIGRSGAGKTTFLNILGGTRTTRLWEDLYLWKRSK